MQLIAIKQLTSAVNRQKAILSTFGQRRSMPGCA